MYSSGQYINNNNLGTTLTLSDSDNRDPISSSMLKSSSHHHHHQQYRGKSPVTNPTPLPTHSYYTRSKSVEFFFSIIIKIDLLFVFL
mgnify:CR=1 FL=1